MKNTMPIILLAALFCLGCNQSDTGSGEAGSTDDSAVQASPESVKIERYKPERDSKVVARVNGVPIYEEEVRGNRLDAAITDEILYQEGLRRGIDKKLEDQIMAYKTSVIVSEVRKDIVENLPPEREVTDKDIELYYEGNKQKYSTYHIVQISFTDESLGPEIMKMAGEGKNLNEIAASLAERDQGIIFNDLGEQRALMRHFRKREEGALSEVIKQPDGTFGVYKITGVNVRPLGSSKFAIKQNIQARRDALAMEKKAREIAEQNNMEIEILNRPDN